MPGSRKAHKRGWKADKLVLAYSSWIHFRKREMLPVAVEKKQFILDALIGWRKIDSRAKTPRGALTLDKLSELVDYCRAKGNDMYAEAFITGYAAALRLTELSTLIVGSVRFLPGDKIQLALKVVEKRGGDRNSNANPSLTQTVRECKSGFQPLFEGLVRSRYTEDRLFPGFYDARSRTLIRNAAQEFQWDPTVKWDGAHTLRHGSAVDSSLKEDQLASVMRLGGWRSRTMAQWYSRAR